MTLTIRNRTAYPDDEVFDLVRFALREFELHNVLIEVTTKSYGHYSGSAYNYVPSSMRLLSSTATRAIRIRIGKPDAFPMSYTVWRHGLEEDHRGEWPLFRHQSWQEALVYVAAHEAKHIEDYQIGKTRKARKRRARVELACELVADKVLTEYRTSSPQSKKEVIMADEATTIDQRAELEAAIAAVPGVQVNLSKSPIGYSIVKYGKTTLGYVQGKKKVRVDLPTREGAAEKLYVENADDVATAVAKLSAFIPAAPETGEQAETKTTRAKKTTTTEQPIEGTVVLAEGREVTPDPKPAARKRTRKSASKK